MKTLNDHWKEYRDAAYPTGMFECHQAFMAGALSFNQMLDEIAALPEDKAMGALAMIKNEVWEINGARAHTLKAMN